MPQRQPSTALVCGEVRGGNEPVWTVVDLPGLAGVLYSHPCHGASGGDVHYCSMCNSGIIARVCLADVAGHGERVAGVARVMHTELRASVNSWDEREVMRALDVRLEQSGLKAITTAALDQGLVVLSCGVYGNVLRVMVPLSASDEIVDQGLEILGRALATS